VFSLFDFESRFRVTQVFVFLHTHEKLVGSKRGERLKVYRIFRLIVQLFHLVIVLHEEVQKLLLRWREAVYW